MYAWPIDIYAYDLIKKYASELLSNSSIVDLRMRTVSEICVGGCFPGWTKLRLWFTFLQLWL